MGTFDDGTPHGYRGVKGALRSWREIQNREREFLGNDCHRGDYVFTFEDGRPPHPDTIRQRFDPLAAAAGLTRITFHVQTYAHVLGNDDREAAEQAAAFLVGAQWDARKDTSR